MNDTSTPVKNRKTRYDLNFKRSAVELWQSSGKSAEALATELGISGQTLKVWKQQLCLPPPPSTAQTMAELQAENRRLRRDLHFALRQREILKKTLGILASPSDNASSI
jgi:transposase-like protein